MSIMFNMLVMIVGRRKGNYKERASMLIEEIETTRHLPSS